MDLFLTHYENLLVSQQPVLLTRLASGQHNSLFFCVPEDITKSQVRLLDSGTGIHSSKPLSRMRFEVSAQLRHSAETSKTRMRVLCAAICSQAIS